MYKHMTHTTNQYDPPMIPHKGSHLNSGLNIKN
jgi:hypothetical protein